MKRKISALVLFMSLSLGVMAFDKQSLAQSLDSVAQLQAWQIGNVEVKQVRQIRGHYHVYTNQTLGHLSISPSLLDTLCHVASRELVGKNSAKVVLYSDGVELSTLITSIHRKRTGKGTHLTIPETTPLIQNRSRAYSAPKGLDHRHIVIYGSHGIYYHQGLERWLWQRAKMFTTVEDLYTSGYTLPFLAPMLENAGAVVMMPRERDRQLNEVIVDDATANSGSWQQAEGGWGAIPDGVLFEGENPFTFGGYSFTQASDNALTYTPEIPEEGEYAVYISYKSLANSTDKALYQVMHEGVLTEYNVNQQMGGGTWIYLGTFRFGTDSTKNYVRVSSSHCGKVLTSDAIRFGGGWGNIARYPNKNIIENVPSAKETGQSKRKKQEQEAVVLPREKAQEIAEVSGFPRWQEASRYWQQYSGVPDSIYNYTGSKNDYTDDYATRGNWINWLAGGSAVYPDGEGLGIPVELALAFHTDAGTTPWNEIIGTLAIYTSWDDEKNKTYPTGATRQLARDFADYMQTQIVNDVRALYAPEWTRRRLHNSSYAESRKPKVPTVLLEFLSHQNFADMKYGLDPGFRFVVSRAIYKSMLRFNHEQYGTPYMVQPLPVKDFSIRFKDDKQVVLRWKERVDSLEATATPTYYVVYTRRAGEDWDNGQKVKTNELTLTLEPGVRYDFKVAAGNDGGISFPSEILSAHKAANERGKVLIVNGFDRVSAPEHFESKDSTYAGFKPNHFGIGYMSEPIYIGEQFEFERSLPWVTDDNCGFGTCYTDKQYLTPIGNTFDMPAKHGKVLADLGYSYVSCSASSLDTIAEEYAFVDLIFGKQKKSTIGTEKMRTQYEIFTPQLRKVLTAYKGNLLLSGAYIGSEMFDKEDKAFTSEVLHYAGSADKASKTGEIRMLKPFANLEAQLVMEQNDKILPCESPDGLNPTNGAVRIARYGDSRIGAGVAFEGDNKQLIFGFALESLEDFDTLYQACVNWLMK